MSEAQAWIIIRDSQAYLLISTLIFLISLALKPTPLQGTATVVFLGALALATVALLNWMGAYSILKGNSNAQD